MSDPASKTLIVDQDMPPVDWHAAAPTLKLRWLVGVALAVPLLLAAGVYWLHHVPSGIGLRITSTADTVIEVRLITPQERQERKEQGQQAAPLASHAALIPQSERLIDDQDHSIPTETVAPASAEPSRALPSATTSAPVSSAAVARMPTNEMALMFQRALLSHIARYRRYPDEAVRERAQGTVQMVFALQRDGMVTDVWIKSSSGYKVLDAAAVDIIRKAQPLPKIPPELPDRLNILMPMAFDLP